ncbi:MULTISPECIES: hypothetical protein [Sphingomonas]|uniref:hypothetical protein n=1 Tax=Sphingomonas TaxID=13687 RepID=UPI000DF01CF0|nr:MULTISPECIES: hypothetical protein [Sphingomonas]
MPYRTDRRDRAKSLGLVLGVHLALGLALIAGLRGPALIRAARDQLTTFDVAPPPPTPLPPPARETQAAPKEAEGATDLAAKPAPVILPVPPRPLPTPLPVAREPAPVTGRDQSSGAGLQSGTGNGAGANGAGIGGGGNGGQGDGVGRGTGARWLGGGLARPDYRVIRSYDVPAGSAAYAIRVDASGRATDCRARQSSGDSELDAVICQMLVPRLRFAPARDSAGRPRPDEITYIANWSRR